MKNTWFTPAILALALLAGACGKDNESGKKSGGTYFGSLGTLAPGQVPPNITNSYAQQVFQSTTCTTGGQRIGVAFNLTDMTVAANATYIGITSEGDVAVVTNNGGQALFSAFICARPSLGQGSGSLSRPALNRSLRCLVDEITAADMQLPGAPGYPPYLMKFRAIHFGGPGSLNTILPQICR
ncbi:MAG: hypothetical protein ACLGG0_10150 [Bacteriovoracia bacterium]